MTTTTATTRPDCACCLRPVGVTWITLVAPQWGRVSLHPSCVRAWLSRGDT